MFLRKKENGICIIGMFGKHHSEEAKQKMSKAHKGKPNLKLRGHSVSEETRKKLSIANKGHLPWSIGKHHSEETKRRISKAKKGKPSWNKGIKCPQIAQSRKGMHPTEETKQKMSKAHKNKPTWNKGKIGCFSPETLKKMSIVFKGRPSWIKGLTKETNEKVRKMSEKAKGRHHSEETKRKISLIVSKHPQRYWLGKKHPKSEETKKKYRTPEYREWARKQRLHIIIPFKDTSIERKMQDELASREIGFYKHYPVIGQPDITFSDRKIAVFCDGDYWHGEREGRKESDARVNEKLRNEGWLVLRYWEHEINANVEGVVDEIEEVIQSQKLL